MKEGENEADFKQNQPEQEDNQVESGLNHPIFRHMVPPDQLIQNNHPRPPMPGFSNFNQHFGGMPMGNFSMSMAPNPNSSHSSVSISSNSNPRRQRRGFFENFFSHSSSQNNPRPQPNVIISRSGPNGQQIQIQSFGGNIDLNEIFQLLVNDMGVQNESQQQPASEEAISQLKEVDVTEEHYEQKPGGESEPPCCPI